MGRVEDTSRLIEELDRLLGQIATCDALAHRLKLSDIEAKLSNLYVQAYKAIRECKDPSVRFSRGPTLAHPTENPEDLPF